MSIIRFSEVNCKNCYKCIRYCEPKAIRFFGEHAYVNEEDCILCGTCTLVCPQKAKQIVSHRPQVQQFLEEHRKIVVSLAPSYVSAFPGSSFAAISLALKKLGFFAVEETAIGASQVSKEYERLLNEGKMRNIITTCCPSVVMLVEKYFPALVDCLAPVISPLAAHARMIKEAYGDDTLVVFVGPCIAKIKEGYQLPEVDGVILFDELIDMLALQNIIINDDDPEAREMVKTRSRLYPIPGGILKTIEKASRKKYKSMVIDGIDACLSTLRSMGGITSGYFIEMSICLGSCIRGPGLASNLSGFLAANDALLERSQTPTQTPCPPGETVVPQMTLVHSPRLKKVPLPTEEQIAAILAKTGKFTEKDMLNCGTCGYRTCRDKAVAVFQGKADIRMCLPYMRDKAESMSNLILDSMPDALIMLNTDFIIIEANPAAGRLFGLAPSALLGRQIEGLLDCSELANVRLTKEPVPPSRRTAIGGRRIVEQSIMPVGAGDYLLIAKDVTEEEAKQRATQELRQETIQTTQEVIDKQMRVAQEIASLLGETTGETKAALQKLKRSIVGDKK